MNEPSPIDWQTIAKQLRTIRPFAEEGRMELGGTDLARAAIGLLIGSDRLAAAVDYYVSMKPGYELARSVLWLLHPEEAMVRCREIFTSTANVEARRSAIELLRVIADRRVLPWVEEFLADRDPEIQVWAIGIVDQLLFSRLVELRDCERILRLARVHDNDRVRSAAAELEVEVDVDGYDK